MKSRVFNVTVALALALSMSSCYVYTFNVGAGPKTFAKVKKWNHYVFYGLAPVDISNPNEMAGGANDYEVTTKFTFLNMLVTGATFGLYSPTTTFVTK